MATDSTTSGGTPARVPLPSSRRGLKGFFAEVSRETKKVHWPTKAETNRLTGVVFAVCTLVALILLGLSIIFENVVNLVTTGRI
jgi:preprotein translocase SecE subunit